MSFLARALKTFSQQRSISIALLALFGGLSLPSDAQTGQLSESFTVTGYVHNPSETEYGGTVSPGATVGGYVFQSLYSAGVSRAGVSSKLAISGFASNPGSGWLQSITCGANTLTPSSALSVTYSGTTITYFWRNAWLVQASPDTCTLNYAGTGGSLFPKYQVVGLTYAPPGSKSTATYSNGFMSGTATSNTSTFSNSITVKAILKGGIDVFGIFGGTENTTISAGWTQDQNDSSSLSIVEQLTSGLVVPGPPLSSIGQDQGVDHDYDTVYVWLNPAVRITFSGQAAVFSGYDYDDRDGHTPETCNGHTYAGVTGIDVVPLTIGQLRGTQPITDQCLLVRLSRPWDPNLGGLTSADFSVIATADPFVLNPSFNPNSDTSGRYDVPSGQNQFFFLPGSATQTYSSSYTSTSMKGQSVKNTFTTTVSLAGEGSADFIAKVNSSLSVSYTYTYSNQWSKTVTSGTSQSSSFIIVPPTPPYNGPTSIQIWKDNIYGSFMFFPEN